MSFNIFLSNFISYLWGGSVPLIWSAMLPSAVWNLAILSCFCNRLCIHQFVICDRALVKKILAPFQCKQLVKHISSSRGVFVLIWQYVVYELCCPTLTKGSNWQITQIWESVVCRLDLAYSTSIPSLEQKPSSCWKIFKSRHHDIALMSVYMTDTFLLIYEKFHFQELLPFVSNGLELFWGTLNGDGIFIEIAVSLYLLW